MVSNESAIHLDSALMRCPSVVYNFSNNPILDYYSYIKSGLVKVANDEHQLLEMTADPAALLPTDKTLQFYNASCGTASEGHLGEVLAQTIKKLCT